VKSLIIDDEPSARSRLARLLEKHPLVSVIGESDNGPDAIMQIEKLRPDLLFLDVEMPGLTGFDILRALPDTTTLPLVIFVTGYDQHALAAFEANALAYLLKPVEPDRLAHAVERARRLFAFAARRDGERHRVLQVAREVPKVLRQVVCRKHGRIVLTPAQHILWFQIESGVVRAKTASDTFWVNYQLGELETSLPADLFFRARRELLINLTKVKEIRPSFKSGFVIVMSDPDGTEIVVSERQVPVLRARMPGL
jgi:two-component system LytT family response regulator